MLGETPRCAQRGWLLSLREFESRLSALTDSFLFRKRLRPSRASAPRALPFYFSQGPVRRKQRGRGFERLVTSEPTSAQCPRASPSPQRESIHRSSSLSMISVPPLLWATWSRSVEVTARCMTAFLWWLRTRRSYRALWVSPPSCRCPLYAMPDSERGAHPCHDNGYQWARVRVVSAWGAILQQAGRFSRGAIRPLANARPPSSLKSMTSSLNRGVSSTRLASVLLPLLPSPPLTTLKRRDMSTCSLWMSPWPRISAHPRLSDGRRGWAIRPSRAEPLLHLLDAPTLWLDRRFRRCTLWLCFRSSRPRCSPVRMLVWMTKDKDKVPFLDNLVSSGSLFGPAV